MLATNGYELRGPMPGPEIGLLLRQLHRAYDVQSWHGTNLNSSLHNLAPELAIWRPQPERHNIAELVVHAAYWKYRVYRRISAAEPRSFDLPGSNFFTRELPYTDDEWVADRNLLRQWHERLVRAVELFDPDQLPQQVGKSIHTYYDLILGAAAHDLYHAGQIQLLKRLHKARPPAAAPMTDNR